jgi:hypothetical protein
MAPLVRAPLQRDSAERVHHAIDHARRLIAAVENSLREAVEASRHGMEELEGKGVDKEQMAAVVARMNSVEHLLSELTSVRSSNPVEYHPAVLIGWREILERRFVRGVPAVRVEVVIVYVL